MNTKLKRITAVLSSITLVSSMSSCGKKQDDNTIKIAYLPITHSLAVLEAA